MLTSKETSLEVYYIFVTMILIPVWMVVLFMYKEWIIPSRTTLFSWLFSLLPFVMMVITSYVAYKIGPIGINDGLDRRKEIKDSQEAKC